MPFSPPIDINRRYERPGPLDGLRALAISLEEEDRAELGGYIAVVLQKLANMNELFLGTRVRESAGPGRECCDAGSAQRHSRRRSGLVFGLREF